MNLTFNSKLCTASGMRETSKIWASFREPTACSFFGLENEENRACRSHADFIQYSKVEYERRNSAPYYRHCGNLGCKLFWATFKSPAIFKILTWIRTAIHEPIALVCMDWIDLFSTLSTHRPQLSPVGYSTMLALTSFYSKATGFHRQLLAKGEVTSSYSSES